MVKYLAKHSYYCASKVEKIINSSKGEGHLCMSPIRFRKLIRVAVFAVYFISLTGPKLNDFHNKIYLANKFQISNILQLILLNLYAFK